MENEKGRETVTEEFEVTPEMIEAELTDSWVSILTELFRAWGDPLATDTGDCEIDEATTPLEMAQIAASRLVASCRNHT